MAIDIDAFATFPFLDRQMIDGLKQELREYLATAEDVSDNMGVVGWWKGQEVNNTMPHWTCTCKLILLIQPSLAAAERVFSLLNNSQQESLLEEYLQISVMLQYSYRKICNHIWFFIVHSCFFKEYISKEKSEKKKNRQKTGAEKKRKIGKKNGSRKEKTNMHKFEHNLPRPRPNRYLPM